MTVQQLTEQDLRGMSPEAIDAAHAEGRLDTLLGRTVADTAAKGQLTADDLKGMSPEAITAAQDEGRLNTLLGRQDAA